MRVAAGVTIKVDTSVFLQIHLSRLEINYLPDHQTNRKSNQWLISMPGFEGGTYKTKSQTTGRGGQNII